MKCPTCKNDLSEPRQDGFRKNCYCETCDCEWDTTDLKKQSIIDEQAKETERLKGVLREIAIDSCAGVMHVSTFHEALNYLRSINEIAKKGAGDE